MQKTAKRILSLALVLTMMLSLSISVSAADAIELEVGKSQTLQNDGAESWVSDDPNVASVSNGVVTGVSAGTTTVRALGSIGGTSDAELETWTVVVSDPAAPQQYDPIQIWITGESSYSLKVGGEQTLMSSYTGGDGTVSYQWSSSNTNVIAVSGSDDTATARAVGSGSATVTVTASSDGKTATNSVSFTVEAKPTATTYNATASASVGTSINMSTVANAIAGQFNRDLGETLGYGAQVRFSTASNTYGSLRFGNGGDLISTNESYAFAVFQDMIFEPASAGTFTTSYTATQGDLSISGSITISVTGGARITNVTMSPTSVELATYSSRYLSLSVAPSSAAQNVSVNWTTSNSSVATVSGSGLTATVYTQDRAGNATITATVTDSNGTRLQATCVVYVTSSATYNPTLSVTLGSDYYGTDTSNNMANQFYNVYRYSLNYNSATIRFSNTGNTNIGVLRLSNGQAIRANYNYTFNEWVNSIHFEPLNAGTFSIPYTLSYNGDSLTGTFSIYVRGSNISATMSPTSMTLATYSNQYLSLDVTPKNAYYTVNWSSSNTNIATVSGSGTFVTVNTKGTGGTVTISATVRDASGVTIVKNCTVTVTSSASYSPSVSTTLGVPYTGTGTSTAMIQQFRTLYGVTLNNNNAKIRFSTTGNNNIATMRLSNGTAIKANTDYTMTQYIAMYTDPVAAGTFTIPYTLTYNSKSLTGNVNVVINPNTVNVGINLNNTNAYLFSSASANGQTGGNLLGNTITNAVGNSWSYLRFTATSSSVGTLYANSSRSGIANTNIGISSLSNLYFVPAAGGNYSINFTVYNAGGSTLATGTLTIIVNAPAAQTNTGKKPVVVKSPQKLAVNGVTKATEIYNIDNTNYFKLRDLAALLNGTPYQFNVDFNSATNTIVVRTKTPYTTANGYELQTGVDNSSKAVVSAQSLEIDGVRVNLTAFNIGGTNFFGLRALEPYIGYTVGYDSATNTATITSR